MSNNLREAFKNDKEKYKQVLGELQNELRQYYNEVGLLYLEKRYTELKTVSHKIRNIAGAMGYYPLKILSSYWEEVCAEEKNADVEDYKMSINKAIEEIGIEQKKDE
jgi:hypothetical protein